MSGALLYAIGNFTIDDIVVWPSGRAWMGQPGGNALFAALGARVWLERVGLLARVGRDYPPERLEEMAARGLCLGLHPVPYPTLHDWALYEAEGARQFVNHLNSGTNEQMTLAPEEIPDDCRQGAAYHIAPVPVHQQARLVRALRAPGRLISLDPHEDWIRGREAEFRAVLAEVDFFLPSRVEARLLYGADAPAEAAREFAAWGPRVVVVKLGAAGSLVYERDADRLAHVGIYPAAVRDPTGAGDAYCGGFLAACLLGRDPVTAARCGTVSASFVVEAISALATRQPAPEEAQARLAQVSAG